MFEINLSDKKYIQERSPYTINQLLGDIGGFAGSVIGIVASIMGLYAPKMFQESITSQVPFKRNKSDSGSRKLSHKFKSAPSDLELEKDDVDALSGGYTYTERLKTSLLKLFCTCFCRKDRDAKHKARAMEFFHDSLDIQNLFNNYLNLSLLIKILMT